MNWDFNRFWPFTQSILHPPSLLYSFDSEDISSGSEIAILASFAEVSVITYSRHVTELYRRGLVQQRGKWCAVLPHAISNRLAIRAIEALPKDLLIQVLVEKASDRVARSFSRRLGYLHESRSVCAIVQEWLEPSGRYGDLTSLNNIGREIFANIAPVHQEAALHALERATLIPNFVSTENYDRSHFARIARSLAYDPVLFDQSINVLLRFVIAEPEGYNRESTRDMLKSLFCCHLSGTEARSAQRTKIVRDLILSTDEMMRKIGFTLLDAALEAWHFSSHYGFDFGARKRGYGWWPRTYDDVREWYNPFIDIAVEVGKNLSESGRQARVVLGESVRGLWVGAGLNNEISSAGKELLQVDGWPEGWLGIRSILQYDKDKLGEESLHELSQLEQLLAPRELRAKIGAKVLARGSFADDLDEGDDDTEEPSVRYRRAEQVAEDLGKAAAIENDLLSELLPDLLNHSTNSKIYNFGLGAGQEIYDATKLLTQARQVVGSAKPGEVSLIFLRGFITGRHKVRPEEVSAFLDDAYSDEVWGKWFPELQLRVDLDDVGFERFIKSLEWGKTPVWQYKYLSYGRATEALTVEQIFALIDGVGSKPEGGLEVAIDILYMVIHCSNEKDEVYRQDLATTCLSFLEKMDWSKLQGDNGNIDYQINNIIEFVLSACISEDRVNKILHNLVDYERSQRRKYSSGIGKLLAPFFKHFPMQALDAIYVTDEDGEFHTALRIVSRLDNDRQETAIRKVPLETLIKWCEISPEDRYIFAAQTCRLFEKASSDISGTTAGLILSEAAIRVLAGARNKQTVLHIFIDRFHPSGWTGSLAAILRERIPLLAKLNPTGDEKIRDEIVLAEIRLRKQISAEEEREEARERRQTGSFE
ncbi:MAG: hypothetical protein M0T70_17450 [Geobacteraceae bacterium]|nr:hypothetical protein [Geobacteraceae bacterium]